MKLLIKKELMGYARIWFNGEYIGSKKELIYLKVYLLERLKRISEKKILNINNDNIIEKYNLLENRLNDLEDNDIHKYLVSARKLLSPYKTAQMLRIFFMNILIKY